MQYVHTCKQEPYPSFLCNLFYVFYLYLVQFLVISSYEKTFRSFVYVIIYWVDLGIIILKCISDEIYPNISLSKDGKYAVYGKKKDGGLFICRQSWHFSFIHKMSKVFFPIGTLNWRVNNYVSRQGKGINRRNKNTTVINI